MPLSWNEIKHRAIRFGADWKDETREAAERQTFWNEKNNFPWPTSPTDAQRQAVEKSAQAVLDARAKFPDSTLADLYDPVTMPPVLVKAHADLDRAVERCYRKDPFPTDRSRVEFLFAFYENLTAPLVPAAKPKRARTANSVRPVKPKPSLT